ncbi:MAG: MFS transporter [Myxococcota bacterium]
MKAIDGGRLERELARSAFSYPSYRRYWVAGVAMVFGLQFRFIGSGWLVHTLTESPFWLGVPGVVSAIVTISLTIPAGALADRVDCRRLVVIGRAGAGLLHGALGLAVWLDQATVSLVVAWAAGTGALAALTNPAQAAMLPRLIERQAMQSAVAYTSAIWNSMRIIGPAAAGLMIAWIGIGQAFFVTMAGYALSAGLVASLELAPPDAAGLRRGDDRLLAGVRYIFRNRIFLATIGLSFFSSLFGRSYVVLLPVFADDILHIGVRGFGSMEAAAGVGALAGTLAMARIRVTRHAGHAMVAAAIGFGLGIALFAASRDTLSSLLLLAGGSLCASIYLNLGMTTLQLLVPDALRGRVMGVWGLTWFLSSAGGFVAATLAEWIGVELAVGLGALAVSAFAAAIWLTSSEVRGLDRMPEGIR